MRSVARSVVRILGGRARGRGGDASGRTRMVVTGGVRVALYRLARWDRRDASRATRCVTRRMRRDLRRRARGGGTNVGRGMLRDVASSVRRELGRLARGDGARRRSTVGDVPGPMMRVLWRRPSGSRRDAGRRTTLLVTSGVRVTLGRRHRRSGTSRDASRTTSRSIASGMRRDLGRQAGRGGRNTGRGTCWGLPGVVRRELRRRTNRGDI
ncbi:hypothetical protein GSI_11408 [Ganoderma sinense ZZ0214-1]|uniref:Uncharacterized protein n=1 Tax=Ganoderma sinense ZZ0214-1 TaxID=1077348 RepID=A0A2G8RWF4_9APHY|nr:hypothetical protein GSI_11408 [Ganoderma sinense ZZ0214-1]